MIDQLLAQFKPGITSATDGLSASAAETIIAKLKDWLDGDDEEIGAGVAPTEQMEQLQVAEVRNVQGLNPALWPSLLIFKKRKKRKMSVATCTRKMLPDHQLL